jgi:hypothetical protein
MEWIKPGVIFLIQKSDFIDQVKFT